MKDYTLDDVHALAQAYLLSRPDCRAFWPTVQGKRDTVAGGHDFAQANAQHVIAHMDTVLQTTTGETDALVRAVVNAREQIDWFNIYKPDAPVGKGKMERTAVSMISGDGAAFTAPQGKMGFYFLREGVEYAAHSHKPDEIYAILSGRARYWNEDTGWHTFGAGHVIQTPSWQQHAMTTAFEPVLILWAWVGEDLDVTPKLHDPNGVLPKGA